MNDLLNEAGLTWYEFGSVLRSLAYFMLALGCASLALAQRHQTASEAVRALGALLIPVYFLLSANALLHGEDYFVPWAREWLKEQHLYGMRRLLQGALLLGLVWWVIMRWQPPEDWRGQVFRRQGLVWLGLLAAGGISAALVALQYLSFHYIDLVLDMRMAGHRLAGWVEAGAAILAAWAITQSLRRSSTHV